MMFFMSTNENICMIKLDSTWKKKSLSKPSLNKIRIHTATLNLVIEQIHEGSSSEYAQCLGTGYRGYAFCKDSVNKFEYKTELEV